MPNPQARRSAGGFAGGVAGGKAPGDDFDFSSYISKEKADGGGGLFD